MSEINVKQEFINLIPPPTQVERDGLEASILAEGCRDALVLWNGYIVDGHNRYAICEEHDIDFDTVSREFEDENAAKLWMIDNQNARRNLTDGWRYQLAQARREILLAAGKEKRELTQFNNGKSPTVLSKLDKTGSHNTRNEVADSLGWSTGKTARAQYVWDHADEDTKKEVKSGEKSIHGAYAEIKKEKRRSNIEKQINEIKSGAVSSPDGLYDVLSVDPPWPYGTKYDAAGRRAASPYPEMSLDKIKEIQLPAADDCVLWLWTTHKFMRYSFDILDTWGFRDVSILTWEKDRMGLGQWLRSKTEFCIMAVKGKPIIDLTSQTTIIHGKLREHSRKPDEFFDMVDSLCVGKKLDYFSREPREGWSQFGNELAKFN